jgi:hypothetical protein
MVKPKNLDILTHPLVILPGLKLDRKKTSRPRVAEVIIRRVPLMCEVKLTRFPGDLLKCKPLFYSRFSAQMEPLNKLATSKTYQKYHRVVDMTSISSRGICGEDNFRCPRLKEARLPAGKAGGHQVEKSRCDLDMGS